MASAGKRGRKGKGNKRKSKVFKAKARREMLSTLEDKAAADYDDLANNAIASLEAWWVTPSKVSIKVSFCEHDLPRTCKDNFGSV